MPLKAVSWYRTTQRGEERQSPGPQARRQAQEEEWMASALGEVIYTYSRAQALEDGVLIDVSEMAREAGFVWPVAVTAGVWALIKPTAELARLGQSVEGRLWDTLWLAGCTVRKQSSPDNRLTFEVAYLQEPGASPETFTLHIVAGPGDSGEPVITIMRPGEG